ncbi:hypothetical protein FLK61_40595 [Paenalkalicoccus suaedae]|uniref:HEAT repeat domain-containing protein n=1 Tax=Paenalkalicoccus suaedae TaxID=2592382 RepID=A0A859FIE8_9BACI|nr:hypothetical protein [Paenalkalicoccus suaedae]QKS72901.1 hypothetical protein FLK61_40595 [Paenalkalicoccus suaedae]
MIFALWLLAILVITQLVLLVYTIMTKRSSIRQDRLLNEAYEKMHPKLYQYFIGEEAMDPRLPDRQKTRVALVELSVDQFLKEEHSADQCSRAKALAEKVLSEPYKRILRSNQWAERMNALYYIEDFEICSLEEDVTSHLRAIKHPGGEEYRQALRVLAVMQSDIVVEELIKHPHSIVFCKEILRRMNHVLFDELASRLGEESHPELYQAFIVHVGEHGLDAHMMKVEKAFRDTRTETRLKALRAIAFSKKLRDSSKLTPFFTSEIWQERMYAAKVVGAIEDKTLLAKVKPLLSDREWWVRYAAADTIATFGISELYETLPSLEDPYAEDMIRQMITREGGVAHV